MTHTVSNHIKYMRIILRFSIKLIKNIFSVIFVYINNRYTGLENIPNCLAINRSIKITCISK